MKEPTWTYRIYPCGCKACGHGDVPAYCGKHDVPPSRHVTVGVAYGAGGNSTQPLVLPTDEATRSQIPLAGGCLDYFPLALAAVAQCSLRSNEQHNPGEPMHWARGKSLNHRDKIMKHLIDSGAFDIDGIRHSTKLTWRALALLQTELEADGGRPGRASIFPTTTSK